MIEQRTKVFKDNVHGYIEIPLDYVELFVDTEIFQRLRGIEQTGMRTLFPSARHDRFIHSLGTFYLGHKAQLCFQRNVKARYNNDTNSVNHYNVFKNESKSIAFWENCRVLFEIACLLHDCGHAPFSHTLEFHYDKESLVEPIATLKDKLKEYIGTKGFLSDFKGQGSPHERMSALIVCTEFQNQINGLLTKYGLLQIDDENAIEFIVRMIIGCKFENETKPNQIRNCFIELLNSKSIDVDSLDYIIRDSKLSGIDNMNIDVDRLLGSLTLIEETEFVNVHFRNIELSTNITEGILVKNGIQAKINGKCRGSVELKDRVSGTVAGMVDIDGNFRPNNKVVLKPNSNGNNVLLVNGVSYINEISPLEHSANVKLYGSLQDEISIKGEEVNFGEDTNSIINVNSDSVFFSSVYVNAKLEGIFKGVILGNYSHIAGGKLKCRLGFHKSSLSVIQNVIIARNYEYQWIYSHHKVVYSANYLIIDLFRNCIEYLLEEEHRKELLTDDKVLKRSPDDTLAKILSWDTMINHSDREQCFHFYKLGCHTFFRISDADVMSLFKDCYIDCIEKGRTDILLYKLLVEYHTRKFKHSLWKSFAEFNLFFNDFTIDDRKLLFEKMIENSGYHLFDQYGYFNEEWERAFNSFGMYNVVWVNGDSKLKSLNPDDTFIAFKDEVMTYRTISASNDIRPVSRLDLFYIYYDVISKDSVNRELFKDYLREKIQL
ncbi:MAG: HD domain-containing protein [Lachnospiraceae bacterium]